MSTLPPELVDEILIHLRHDKKALCHCSLVAKSWTYSSQKLLYSRVHITPSAYQTRQEIASPTSTELLQHVHSLTCHQFQSLHDLHKDYLESFHRLQRLTLDDVDGVDPDVVNLFPAFQNTLSSLSLFCVSLTLDAFINLFGYFPNLRELQLGRPTFYPDHRTVPPPSTPPRGKLRLSMLSEKDAGVLLRGLRGLELEYDELELYQVGGLATLHTGSRSIVSKCEKTLRRLTLGPYDSNFVDTLDNLSELRELVFTLSLLFPEEITLISTIASTNIRRILFATCTPREPGHHFWSSLDTELSSLVDRLRASGYQHVLDVEFRRELGFAENISEAGPDTFLPKFSEKGRVTISQSGSGRILYCSDGSLGGGLDSQGFEGSETS